MFTDGPADQRTDGPTDKDSQSCVSATKKNNISVTDQYVGRKASIDIVTFLVAGNGVPLRFYKSAKQSRPKVSCTSVKGGTCKKALKVMGGAIRNSTGILTERAKFLLSNIWDETNK